MQHTSCGQNPLVSDVMLLAGLLMIGRLVRCMLISVPSLLFLSITCPSVCFVQAVLRTHFCDALRTQCSLLDAAQ